MGCKGWWGLMCVLMIVGTLPGMARMVTLRQPVLGPDGKPVAGAEVIIRTLDLKDGTPRKEIHLRTGADGLILAEIDAPYDPASGNCSAYILVDVPGYAVTIAPLYRVVSEQTSPIRLVSCGPITGKVVDEDGAPVAGASVAVAAEGSLVYYNTLNRAIPRIETPALATTSGADGSFVLRGMAINMGNSGKVMLAATLRKTDGVYWGLLEPVTIPMNWRNSIATKEPTDSATNLRIVLHPPITVQGRVFNRATGTPLAHATVAIRAEPTYASNVPAAVETDADGRFTISGITHVSRLFTDVTHRDCADTTMQLTPMPFAEKVPTAFTITCPLMPCATVSGRVIDEATGQPIVPVGLSVTLIASDQGEVTVHNTTMPLGVGQRASTVVGADGTFTVRASQGRNQIRVFGVGYRQSGNPAVLTSTVPAEGLQNLTVTVAKQRGVLLRFVPKKPGETDQLDIAIRKRDDTTGYPFGTKVTPVMQGYLFYDPAWRGEDVELQATRDGVIVLPWTPISMEFTNWPVEVKLIK